MNINNNNNNNVTKLYSRQCVDFVFSWGKKRRKKKAVLCS